MDSVAAHSGDLEVLRPRRRARSQAHDPLCSHTAEVPVAENLFSPSEAALGPKSNQIQSNIYFKGIFIFNLEKIMALPKNIE